jgi:glycine/D-amino acid oxidase-like deaminating enzyme
VRRTCSRRLIDGLQAHQAPNPVTADANAVAPDADGFFWLAGQGGYGIQTSWAMGLTARELAAGRSVPEKIQGFGVTEADLGPERLWS